MHPRWDSPVRPQTAYRSVGIERHGPLLDSDVRGRRSVAVPDDAAEWLAGLVGGALLLAAFVTLMFGIGWLGEYVAGWRA